MQDTRGEYYPTAEVQSVYSTDPADCTRYSFFRPKQFLFAQNKAKIKIEIKEEFNKLEFYLKTLQPFCIFHFISINS